MSKNNKKTYRIKNLDCANCAANLQESLNKEDWIKNVNLNFASGTIQIESNDIERTIKRIKNIEPDVELHEITGSEPIPDRINIIKELKKERHLIISISILLFFSISGIFFSNTLFKYLSLTFYVIGYFIAGKDVLISSLKNIRRGKIFDEKFLMSVATIGAFIIGEYPEALAVMIFYNIGEFFEGLALDNSRNSINDLIKLKPEKAYKIENGKLTEISPDELNVGDRISVKPGERIPADGEIINGNSQVDNASLTGESIPKNVSEGDAVYAGTINLYSNIILRVTKKYEDSSAGKIIELIQDSANKKTRTEKFIKRFAKYYTPAVVFGALGIALIPPLFGYGTLSEWVNRALILLVISCPCAFIISIPLGYFGGIGRASKDGILIKGSNFIDSLAKVNRIAFDKTGTLTRGIFRVTEIKSFGACGKEEVLEYASIAESHSNHPIAKAILEKYGKKIDDIDKINIQEISGHGIKATYKKNEIIVGNDRILHKYSIEHDKCLNNETVVNVVRNNTYCGYIVIADEIKSDSVEAIEELKELGINDMTILTGDNVKATDYVKKELNITEAYTNLLPEDKVKRIEKIIEHNKNKGTAAFVGDGLNDSPVLARADIGIAMGGIGSEASINNADVVIMNDKISKIPQAIRISRKTKKIVLQNIVLSFVIKGIFISFGIAGIATMWEAVFSDVGVSLIAIFNTMRILRMK